MRGQIKGFIYNSSAAKANGQITYLCGPRRGAEESHISIVQVQRGVEKDVKEGAAWKKTEKMYIYNTVLKLTDTSKCIQILKLKCTFVKGFSKTGFVYIHLKIV